MTRYDEWATRLHGYIETVKDKPFQYGSFDCGLMAAGCIEAMTGEDLAAEFRGYHSSREALQSIKRITGTASIGKLGEYVGAKYELKSVPVLMAQRGDLAIVNNRRFGIVALTGTHIVVPAKRGITQVPLTHATAVYRI